MIQLSIRFGKFILLGIFLTAFLFLSACSGTPDTGLPISPEACYVLHSQQRLIKQLTNAGILLVQVGDEVVIYLPTDNFFYPQSDNLLKLHFLALQRVIALMNTYPLTDVQVIGYTDCTCDPLRNLALSRAQAQAIANYLVLHGLNSRLISAQGMGNNNPIGDNFSSSGRALNRRIEISFRMPPPDNVFH